MYQQIFREKRDYEKELSQTILSLRQEINNVRKQNRELRIEKSAAIEYKSSQKPEDENGSTSAAIKGL